METDGWRRGKEGAVNLQDGVKRYFAATFNSQKDLNLNINFITMSKEEIKYEISKVLDQFSNKALEELLAFLKELDTKKEVNNSTTASLNKILSEDKELLAKLAQ